MTQLDPQQAGVCDETLRLLRHLRIQYRDKPAVYRDLLHLTVLACTASGTELAYGNAPVSGLTLSVQEAADIAGLKPCTIRRACREKRLHAIKQGRDWTVTRTDLQQWMARRAA